MSGAQSSRGTYPSRIVPDEIRGVLRAADIILGGEYQSDRIAPLQDFQQNDQSHSSQSNPIYCQITLITTSIRPLTSSATTPLEPLDSKRLKVFVLIARTGSIAAAAAAANLTPSAVSHSLKGLEEELGNTLFERRGNKALLTTAGQQLLPHANEILNRMSLAREEQAQLREWGNGTIRLGASASACQYFLPDVLLEFRECFPDASLEVISVDSHEAREMIKEGTLELAISICGEPAPEIASDPLFEDELVVIVSPRHPWANLRRLGPEQLNGEKLTLYRRDSLSAKLVRDHLRKLGVSLNKSVSLSSMETIKEMTKVGLCPGVVADWVIQKEVTRGTLVAIPFSGTHLKRQWCALWPSHRPLSIMARTLTGLCKDVTSTPPFTK